MKTSEVLNRAADLIEERGWVQGGEQNPGYALDPWGTKGGPVCMEGAIFAVVADGRNTGFGSVANTCPAGRAVRVYLGLTAGFQRLYHFNDEPGRTVTEVIEVLRATAVIEAAREEAEAELAEWADLYPQLTAVAVEKAASDAKARILGDHEHHVPTPDSPVAAFEAAS